MPKRWLASIFRTYKNFRGWWASSSETVDRVVAAFLAILVAVSYLLFFLDSDPNPLGSLIVTAVWLIVIVPFAFTIAWHGDRIGSGAVVTFATLVFLYVLAFANVYLVMSQNDRACFNETLSQADALYLAMTILTTTNFGDVRAVEGTCRGLVAAQMMFNVVLLTWVLGLLLARFQRSIRREGRPRHDSTD